MIKVYIYFLAVFSCISQLFSQDSCFLLEQKRVKDHLLLKDYSSAMDEISNSLKRFPESRELKVLRIKVLSEWGRDLDAYRDYKKMMFKDVENLPILESISWSVLEKAEHSNQQVVNLSSMVGASLTRDARAVNLLLHNLSSTNAYIRMIAVKLSAQFGDKKLIDAILSKLSTETVWYVKLEMIKALSSLSVEEIRPLLKQIIASSRSSLEERAVAAEAFIHAYDDLDLKQIESLQKSERAGLRHLACGIISYLNKKGCAKILSELLKDSNSDVRMMALNTLCVIGTQEKKEELLPIVDELVKDHNPYVAMTACGVLMYYDPSFAKSKLTDWVFHENPELRRFAATIIGRSGAQGRLLGTLILKSSSDPFVKINIAYGLLGHTKEKKECCKFIADFLKSYSKNVMLDASKNPFYQVISPSMLRHTPEVVQYPIVVDQHIRLHLLNQLAMFRYEDTTELIKRYLKSGSFGMTFAASTLLLEEGGEESVEIIRELLEDPDETIKVQAALVLALYGRDADAIDTLIRAYPKVNREIKTHILEAIGHIGSKDSIPFLVDLLDDPFNVLRIIAASAIIRCIYH